MYRKTIIGSCHHHRMSTSDDSKKCSCVLCKWRLISSYFDVNVFVCLLLGREKRFLKIMNGNEIWCNSMNDKHWNLFVYNVFLARSSFLSPALNFIIFNSFSFNVARTCTTTVTIHVLPFAARLRHTNKSLQV